MKITRTHDKVLFYTNSGIASYSQECNIFAHPRSDKAILIAENGTGQQEQESFIVNYDELTDYNDTPFSVASRDEMIELLTKRYFNLKYALKASRFLDTTGDGTGAKSFTSDNSGALAKAIIKPTGNRSLFLKRLMTVIQDSGSVDAGQYGNGIALASGISMRHEKENGDLIWDLTDGMPIKTNADYARFGHTVTDLSFGSGDNYVRAAYHFDKDGFCIEIKPGERFAIYLNDDFSGLEEQTFRAGAYYLE